MVPREKLKVKDFMTRDVITISPDQTIDDAKELMKNKGIAGLPVINGEQLVGIITISDIITALEKDKLKAKVLEVMTKQVIVLNSDETIKETLSRFRKYKIGRFPVLDNEKIVGIISIGDIVHKLANYMAIDQVEEGSKGDFWDTNEAWEDYDNFLEKGIVTKYEIMGGDFTKAGEAASGTKQFLQHIKINKEIIRRCAIATFEVEMNIVIHSNGGNILVLIKDTEIKVIAQDIGPGIPDIARAMVEGFSTAGDEIRALGFGAGMGLPNIKKNVDEFSIDSTVEEGTRVEFTIFIPKGLD